MHSAESTTELSNWYASDLGRQFALREVSAINQLARSVFGCNGLQLGAIPVAPAIKAQSVLRQVQLSPVAGNEKFSVRAKYTELPVQAGCVDVVFAMHVLEFASNPHHVLREIDRVLDDHGQLIICGFNPFSLAGIMRILWPFKRRMAPWRGHYYSRFRLIDWLTVLNFEIIQKRCVFHNLPIQNEKYLKQTRWLEGIIRKVLPGFGASYVIHAQKRTVPLTPVRARWRPGKDLVDRPAATEYTKQKGQHAKR